MSTKDSEAWMGARGFDEAKYYRDEKSDIGINHSDIKLKERAIEFLDRNLSGAQIEVQVEDGNVLLTGEVTSASAKKEAENTVINITGIKGVRNELKVSDH